MNFFIESKVNKKIILDLNIIDKCLDASLKPEPVSAAPLRLHNFNRKYTLLTFKDLKMCNELPSI